MELRDTIGPMLSSNYKERFVAEYWQTKIRYEKLTKIITSIEASNYTGIKFSHNYPEAILKHQHSIMAEYLHILEIRAEIEHINLNTAAVDITKMVGELYYALPKEGTIDAHTISSGTIRIN